MQSNLLSPSSMSFLQKEIRMKGDRENVNVKRGEECIEEEEEEEEDRRKEYVIILNNKSPERRLNLSRS
jgi:hypothetical protein